MHYKTCDAFGCLQDNQESVEEQLITTMAELAQLRLREQQLLAKNQLLEKLAHMNDKRQGLQVGTMVRLLRSALCL